jgi:hypothetical protein
MNASLAKPTGNRHSASEAYSPKRSTARRQKISAPNAKNTRPKSKRTAV